MQGRTSVSFVVGTATSPRSNTISGKHGFCGCLKLLKVLKLNIGEIETISSIYMPTEPIFKECQLSGFVVAKATAAPCVGERVIGDSLS